MMTNREFFIGCCDRERLAQINRYAQRALEKRVKPEDPIWTKEDAYEKWLNEPIDMRKFEAAKLDKNGHALPENYYYSRPLRY